MKKDELDRVSLNGWPLPEPVLAELGRIAASWSILEGALDAYLGKLAGFDLADPRAFILLKHTSFPQKLDALSALCEHLAPQYPWLAGYKAAVGKIREAQSSRNRFMHNGLEWNAEKEELTLIVGSARGKLRTAVETIQTRDLKRASMVNHEALLELHTLVTKAKYPPMWERSGS